MAEMSFVMKAISTLLSSLKRAVKENPTVGELSISLLSLEVEKISFIVTQELRHGLCILKNLA